MLTLTLKNESIINNLLILHYYFNFKVFHSLNKNIIPIIVPGYVRPLRPYVWVGLSLSRTYSGGKFLGYLRPLIRFDYFLYNEILSVFKCGIIYYFI